VSTRCGTGERPGGKEKAGETSCCREARCFPINTGKEFSINIVKELLLVVNNNPVPTSKESEWAIGEPSSEFRKTLSNYSGELA